MPQVIKPGDDVTSLINGVKEGDDVTSLINGTSTPEVKKPKSLWDSAKESIGNIIDAHPKTKAVGERLLFGETAQDKLDTEKFGEEHGVGKLKLATEGDSVLPKNAPRIGDITGKTEPDTYGTGFANSLYKDFVRPLGSVPGMLGGMVPEGRFSNPETFKALERAKALDLPHEPMNPQIGNIEGPQNAKLGLPAIGESTDNPRRFFQGPAGTTEAGKQYPIDTAPQNPRLGQVTQDISKTDKPNPAPVTVLPRETEGLSNLDPITAANRGTKLGDIQSIDGSSPQGILRSLGKVVNNGEPIKMPVKPNAIGDVAVPNERKLSDSFANTELPNIDARPFGSTRVDKSSPWDTAGQGKTDSQGIVPDTPKTSVNIPSNKGNKVDTANLSEKDNTTGVPAPGQAVSNSPEPNSQSTHSKDINSFRAEFGSVDKTLSSRPETAPIAQHIVGAADQKAQWIATTERQLATITKGLSKGDLVSLGDLVDKGTVAGEVPLHLVEKATAIKQVLDQIHTELKLPQGMNMGYIESYLTHISKLPEDDLKTGIKQIWEYHLGKPFQDIFGSNELGKAGNGVNDLYEKGLGNPDSPFRKVRGQGTADLEMNVNKVLPAYIESIARLKFDKPAVDLAKQVLKTLPDSDIYGDPSKLKELAGWYIKNYTRYDAMPGLSQGWNDYASKLMRTTGRSMLGFSTGLQTLHLARIPANLYPELGEKYLMAGIKKVASNPVQSYKEAAGLGLLQNEVRPWNFKTPMQKVDSILSFFTAADFLDRSIGYHGFKQMALDKGLGEAEASAQALAKSKQASLFVDAARPTKGFTKDAEVFGGIAGRLSTQFKQVPSRIIEQYVQIAANAKQDPAKAARALAGIGLAFGASEAGLHTLHISPTQLLTQMAGAAGTVAYSVGRDLVKGDILSAVKKTALWITPGGMSIERQLRKGLSAFEN